MPNAAPLSVGERMRSAIHDLKRLSYCHHNPERYHELKSDLVGRLVQLDREIANPNVQPFAAVSAPRAPFRTGIIRVGNREIRVEKR